ncbi:MAG: Rne/Rng family ribonuclease [Jatrophihabitans sp.]
MLDADPNDSSTQPERTAPAPRKRTPRKAAAKAGPPPVADAPATSDAPVTSTSASTEQPAARKRPPRKAAAKQPVPDASATLAGPTTPVADGGPADSPTAAKAPAKRTRTRATAASAAQGGPETAANPAVGSAGSAAEGDAIEPITAKKTTRKRAAKKASADAPATDATGSGSTAAQGPANAPAMSAPGVLFMAPATEAPPRRRRVAKKAAGAPTEAPLPAQDDVLTDAPAAPAADAGDDQPPKKPAKKAAKRATKKVAGVPATDAPDGEPADATQNDDDADPTDPDDVREAAGEAATGARRRRRRGRRGRGNANADSTTDSDTADAGQDEDTDAADETGESAGSDGGGDDADNGEAGSRRRRRRRRTGTGTGTDESGDDGDDPPNTVTHVREPKKSQKESGDDGVRGVKGSTRLEAKRQRRRDGRDTNRRRAPILTEAEFLARREAVDRVMAVRQNGDRTQIAVLEDNILVEHYVTRASATSYVGNVYLGRVQNVLPSMEAAFIDIGKGRNGVLYAGEVNWDAAGLEGKSRAIEQALKSGDSVLVQVTKDPIGHKGARLTSQVSLPGRFLVYVPGGGMTGISRRLPDTERHRLKAILKKIIPEDAGVIVRTAAEGASEEDLTRDVERLIAQWQSIQAKVEQKKAAPVLVHGEPDLAIRVVRDVFNEDFVKLVVQGPDAWETVSEYITGVAPDLAERVSKHVGNSDLFHDLRVDEQLMKALDRKVWLPSGGSLVIDRTEAMTVVDVNTGKFIGSGGNLEQTVTRNNIEAAEEIVRQLRLRDVGGIVVIDFIDMVLESNRDLVLRRLTECLGRDRTKHQVAEVTSLGLVQMTRKRVGEGLLEAFSEPCEHCRGRGLIVQGEPVDQSNGGSSAAEDDQPSKGKRRRGGRGGAATEPAETPVEPPATDEQRQAANAAIAAIHRAAAAEQDAAGGSPIDELATGLVNAVIDLEARSTPDATPVSGDEPTQPGAGEPAQDQSDPTREAAVSTAASEVGIPRPDVEAPSAEPTGAGPTDPVVGAAAESEQEPSGAPSAPVRRRRRAASRPAGPPAGPTS